MLEYEKHLVIYCIIVVIHIFMFKPQFVIFKNVSRFQFLTLKVMVNLASKTILEALATKKTID